MFWATLPLQLCLYGFLWWLIRDVVRERRQRRTVVRFAKLYVPELRERQERAWVQRTAEVADTTITDMAPIARPYVMREWDTTVIPRIDGKPDGRHRADG